MTSTSIAECAASYRDASMNLAMIDETIKREKTMFATLLNLHAGISYGLALLNLLRVW